MQKKNTYIAYGVALFSLFALLLVLTLSGNKEPNDESLKANSAALVRMHSPTEGPKDAKVVIVEFFDPACDTCRSFYPMVKQLLKDNPGKIRLVMRYAPFHKGSDKVAILLAAAQKQGKFWQTLEVLFDSQDEWVKNHTANVSLTLKHLTGLGLNMEYLAFEMTSPELQQYIEQDMADANTLSVSQTPEYFVNGRPLPSFGFPQLKQLVEEEITKTR